MQKNLRYASLFSLICLYFTGFFNLRAELVDGSAANDILPGAAMVRVNDKTHQLQYVLLRDEVLIPESDAMRFMKKAYKMGADDHLTLIRKDQDELGFTHYRYQQTYKGYPVLGGVLIAHCQSGRLHSFNGEFFKLTSASHLLMDETTCLKTALDSTQAESYLWQHEEEEADIKQIKEDPKATWFPKGELMYVPLDLNFDNTQFFLTYKFNIHAHTPRTAENVYVSVANAQIIARENMLHTTDVPGTAYTKYSGQKNITTDSTAPFNYRLRESSRGNGIYTLNLKRGTNYGAAVDFLDSNNIWNNVNANKDEVATDCHWGAATTYDYYKNIHNRNSYNNANARINSYVHYSTNYDNAFWDGVRMTYGDGNTFKPLTSIDVCGHEITHAVTSNSANLIYSYESGQLNESFSDIFGNAIERYGKPTSYSWKIGEEITYDGSGLRNMLNPKLKGHPRCYKSTNWYFGTGDNGGVHLNSGVQNWWFYLVTEGGSGTNDVSNVYKVDSLGIQKAEKIAYRNLTVYLTPTSQYADARFYSIRSAIDLYGNCSKEVIAVTNAWYACNVGPKYDSGYVKADFSADTVICNTSKSVKFNNLSTNALSCKWYFGDGNTSTVFNPTKTYSAYGSYTIKLVATSCFKNKKDSLTRTAYVKIDSNFNICNAVIMPAANDSTHKCESWVYDDGGEDIYTQSRISYLRISVPGADSIRIKFSDFDYELNYDSLYIYKGKYPGTGTKIGGYTGSALPNAGKNIVVAGSMVTLRHVSDPYVVGRGFKLYYKAFRKPLDVKAYSDTSICKGTSVLLYAKGSGGYAGDYFFNWKSVAYNDSILVQPDTFKKYMVYLTDVCTKITDSAEVAVSVKAPLEVAAGNDTTICYGNSVNLLAIAKGGRATSYTYTWNNGLGTGVAKTVTPTTTTTYSVILSDNCTVKNDTAFITVKVLNPLKVKIATNDTDICYNKNASLVAAGTGGDSLNYQYMWSNGMGPGNTKMTSLTSSTWLKVTLNDFCSVKPASDSVFINVRAPLSVTLNNDTTLCNGRSTTLNAKASGGKPIDYTFTWNNGVPDTARYTVTPTARKVYRVTLTDNCSNSASDSIVVNLYGAIHVTGLKDTLICVGEQVPLNPVVSGGLSSAYTFSWNLGLGTNQNQTVAPTGTNTYRVIVNDGCTVLGDTGIVTVSVRAALKAKLIGTDTLLCYNRSGAYSTTSNGGVPSQYTYSWNNGEGTSSTFSKTFTQSQWLKVELKDACTVKPGADSIWVEVRPELKVQLNNDSTICKGSDIVLNAVATGGDNTAYTFTWDDALPSSATNTVSPANTTKYKLTLSDNCSDDATDSILVSVLPALKISGLKDTTICYGGTAKFNPVLSGGRTSSYDFTWDNGLGKLSNQTVTPLASTTYKLIAQDFCTQPYDSASITVTVLNPLKLTATLTKDTICVGDSSTLKLSFSGGKPSAYEWFINGTPSTNTSIQYKPGLTTTYLVELKDYCSSDDSKTLNLVVNQLPVVDFNIVEKEMCLPAMPAFLNLSSGGNAYEWQFGNGDISTDFTPNYDYRVAGTYDITLKVISAAGCVNTLTRPAYFKVVIPPTAAYTINPFAPDYLNPEVTFNNQSSNYDAFEWDFGDNSKDVVNISPTHQYADTGVYFTRLVVKNYLGCADTLLRFLVVKDVYRLYIPNAITVNSDNINDSFVVKGRGILYYELKVFNRWGELLYDGNSESKPFNGRNKNGEPLMKGTYIIDLKVRDFEGMMHYERQVLEIL